MDSILIYFKKFFTSMINFFNYLKTLRMYMYILLIFFALAMKLSITNINCLDALTPAFFYFLLGTWVHLKHCFINVLYSFRR